MKHIERKKELLLSSQQQLVQLANLFQLVLQLLVVLYPTLDLFTLFGMQADLPVFSPCIAHGKYGHRMPLAARTLGTSLAVADGAVEQRASHNLGHRRQFPRKPFPPPENLLMFHNRN